MKSKYVETVAITDLTQGVLTEWNKNNLRNCIDSLKFLIGKRQRFKFLKEFLITANLLKDSLGHTTEDILQIIGKDVNDKFVADLEKVMKDIETVRDDGASLYLTERLLDLCN